MNEMENKLKKYYEEVGIASVKEVEDSKGKYDYEKMFDSFGCRKKDDCRDACRNAYKPSAKDKEFTFSPRTERVKVSQYYSEKKYKGHSIPRIVVVSLSASKPMKKKPEEVKAFPPNPHWRGTTTTIRSLLDPFYRCLDPVADKKSQEIIEKLFFHVRTAKCFSNANGTGQEPAQLYKNCGGYLSKEVSILEPDVVVTQGDAAHYMAAQHVFENVEVGKVKGIANSIERLKEDNRRVYWLKSYFPYGRFYSANHAGPKIGCESHIVGAKLENLVRYGRDIKKFMDEEGR